MDIWYMIHHRYVKNSWCFLSQKMPTHTPCWSKCVLHSNSFPAKINKTRKPPLRQRNTPWKIHMEPTESPNWIPENHLKHPPAFWGWKKCYCNFPVENSPANIQKHPPHSIFESSGMACYHQHRTGTQDFNSMLLKTWNLRSHSANKTPEIRLNLK